MPRPRAEAVRAGGCAYQHVAKQVVPVDVGLGLRDELFQVLLAAGRDLGLTVVDAHVALAVETLEHVGQRGVLYCADARRSRTLATRK